MSYAGSDLNEKAFVGALLHLPPGRVTALGELVHEAELSDPRLRIIFKIALDLAAKGEQPDPAKIHGAARTSGAVVNQNLSSLASLLVDLLTNCPNPFAAEYYGRNVLEASLRRSVVAVATKLYQAAEDSGLEMLSVIIEDSIKSLTLSTQHLISAPLVGVV
jgi:replicative DNA helicase